MAGSSPAIDSTDGEAGRLKKQRGPPEKAASRASVKNAARISRPATLLRRRRVRAGCVVSWVRRRYNYALIVTAVGILPGWQSFGAPIKSRTAVFDRVASRRLWQRGQIAVDRLEVVVRQVVVRDPGHCLQLLRVVTTQPARLEVTHIIWLLKVCRRSEEHTSELQ